MKAASPSIPKLMRFKKADPFNEEQTFDEQDAVYYYC